MQQHKADVQQMKWDAQDKELVESTAKSCWNKFTRMLDKMGETLFMVCLVALAIWNGVSMFMGDDKGFSLMRSLLCVYYLFLALLIFQSWRGNINFLTYFGFMRSSVSKAFFLLFCACMCFPNQYSAPQAKGLSSAIAYVLAISAVLQILKLCNKNEAKDNLGGATTMKQPIY